VVNYYTPLYGIDNYVKGFNTSLMNCYSKIAFFQSHDSAFACQYAPRMHIFDVYAQMNKKTSTTIIRDRPPSHCRVEASVLGCYTALHIQLLHISLLGLLFSEK